MISDAELINVVHPAVAPVLGVDAEVLAGQTERRESYASMDPTPAATTMAVERRALVATEMRKEIAPSLGWIFITEHYESGAYEWLVGSTIVRLSKTTRDGRLEDAKAALGLQGVQDTLFKTSASPSGPRDEILIRLMGNALSGASIDAVALGPRGHLGQPIPFVRIAEMRVERIEPGSATVPKPRITVPDVRRTEDESG